MHPTQDVVAALLERGHRTLVYGGDVDWICNVVGNARWFVVLLHTSCSCPDVISRVDALDWSGADDYANATAREWVVDGKAAGVVRAAGPLTFATVSDAGHFVRILSWLCSLLLTVGSGRCRMTSRRSHWR
jgi:carboxypeptidase C (cathepsin A)